MNLMYEKICDDKIDYWNNKFIDIARIHEESITLMKKDGIIK